MLIVYTFIIGVTRGISWYVKACQVCFVGVELWSDYFDYMWSKHWTNSITHTTCTNFEWQGTIIQYLCSRAWNSFAFMLWRTKFSHTKAVHLHRLPLLNGVANTVVFAYKMYVLCFQTCVLHFVYYLIFGSYKN